MHANVSGGSNSASGVHDRGHDRRTSAAAEPFAAYTPRRRGHAWTPDVDVLWIEQDWTEPALFADYFGEEALATTCAEERRDLSKAATVVCLVFLHYEVPRLQTRREWQLIRAAAEMMSRHDASRSYAWALSVARIERANAHVCE